MLERGGHAVTTASDGLAALRVLEQQQDRFDLLLTDFLMPGLNGFNLSRMARARQPSLKILYLSGYSEQAIAMRDPGERLGKLLVKPILPEELLYEIAVSLRA